MTVWTQVSEADVAELKVGMDAYFTTLGQPDRRWDGKLRQILPTPEVVNNVVLYNALFDVAEPRQRADDADERRRSSSSSAAAKERADGAGGGAAPVCAAARAKAARASGRVDARAVVTGRRRGVEERDVTVGVTNRVAAEVKRGLARRRPGRSWRRSPSRRAASGRPCARPTAKPDAAPVMKPTVRRPRR